MTHFACLTSLFPLFLATIAFVNCSQAQEKSGDIDDPDTIKKNTEKLDLQGIADDGQADEKIKKLAEQTNADSIKFKGSVKATELTEVVRQICPSVVLIRTPTGSGSGCVVDPDGWILTNEHVIASAPWDVKTGTQIVRVYFGSNQDGKFELIEEPVWAQVYKVDRRADLALIRCLTLPTGMDTVPSMKIASQSIEKGSDCIAVGMPAASVLWSVRKGTIAGHGEFPKDIEGRIRLGESEGINKERQEELLRYLAPDGDRMVTISTCGINPGDSGGPLMNASGELVAVTYAVPSNVAFKEFGYHVHLEEIHKFLNEMPMQQPKIQPPSSLPRSEFIQLSFATGRNERPRVILKNQNDPLVAVYFDVDQQSVAEINASEAAKMTEKEFWKRLGIEWCVTWDPTPTYFFDCDRDGTYELVFVVADSDGDDVCKFVLKDGQWQASQAKPNFLDSVTDEIVFDRVDIQDRFQRLRHSFLPSILRR